MSPISRRVRRMLIAAVLAALAAAALPVMASAALVTVRVEGQRSTLLATTTVAVGDGRSSARTFDSRTMPHTCPNNTAYQAIELATRGNWDREVFVTRLVGESHTWEPNQEYWIPYYNHNYADWGICELVLREGDTVLMQAGVSGPEPTFVPASVPIALERVSPRTGDVAVGGTLRVHVTTWVPSEIFGRADPEHPGHFIIPPSEPSNGVGYTVTAGSVRATTDGSGNASLRLTTAGNVAVQASMPGSSTNWSRSVPVTVCVEDELESC